MTEFVSGIEELNAKLHLVNPLLGAWQQTPRGAVFLSDEDHYLQALWPVARTSFERGYLLKRQGKLTEALEALRAAPEPDARVQEGFALANLGDWVSLQGLATRIDEASMRYLFKAWALV